MDSEVLQANMGLELSIKKLQAQVAKQEKQLELCFSLISEIGHMVPSIVESFKYEMKKIDETDEG